MNSEPATLAPDHVESDAGFAAGEVTTAGGLIQRFDPRNVDSGMLMLG